MVFAKKSLGQNFLVDKETLKNIINAAELSEEDNVLEIGPGKGVLTSEIVGKTKNIITIEKDKVLASEIAHNFKFEILNFQSISNELIYNFQNKSGIISGDVLDVNLPKLIEENNFYDYKIVANIPYYITGKLLQLFLETKYSPQSMTLLVQKEVAERICAEPGEMSIIAVSVQYYGQPSIEGFVSRECFEPVPKVDSAILRINLLDKEILKTKKQKNEEFFRLVKIGFSSPRKTLVNNLSNGLGLSKDLVGEVLEREKLNRAIRAQELKVEDWEQLVALFDNLKNNPG
jgi:16S rRNA (adenine1518-N6/adenine1519-N6)-dimethyltransferase